MHWYSFLGSDAFSAFRRMQKQLEISNHVPQIQQLSARQCFFVQASKQLSAKDQQLLLRLLPAPVAAWNDENIESVSQSQAQNSKNLTFYVVPRFGTVSPWSSKVMDLVANLENQRIKRIEQGIFYQLESPEPVSPEQKKVLQKLLSDPMVESIVMTKQACQGIFVTNAAKPLSHIALQQQGTAALVAANQQLGLALNELEIEYIEQFYRQEQRDPTDVELMMFAQANSEHCRHKVFRAAWQINGTVQPQSLFAMIKQTHAANSKGVISAYEDNGAVLAGFATQVFFPMSAASNRYRFQDAKQDIVIKVETHNHPTAIAPYPGAATGAGGEIRDEGAVGCGSKPKAGLTGFCVSDLQIPEFKQPWELNLPHSKQLATPLEIMLTAPIGAARYNNEFGRPNLCGYFRTLRIKDTANQQVRGYDKPIMLTGGMGAILREQVDKNDLPKGTPIVVIGGPGLLIGLGGGAASSVTAGVLDEALDFASVQRDNPELQRRCQEVIDRCWQLQNENPILSIHDVGAGGLSNALPELVATSGGAHFRLDQIPIADPSMSPLEIWCNESQERYVLAIREQDLTKFEAICQRENCPFAVVGHVTQDNRITLSQQETTKSGTETAYPIDIPTKFIFGEPPRLQYAFNSQQKTKRPLSLPDASGLTEVIYRILRLPAIAAKGFLITIGDRSVGGLVVRDQMVGPWQVPVADAGVTRSGFTAITGEAMAIGERPLLALINPPAAGRIVIAEALTNICCNVIADIYDIKLSANWMAAVGTEAENEALYNTVAAVSLSFCQQLGIAIPVGKDSLSMSCQWSQDGTEFKTTSPLSLVVSAFTPVIDVRKSLTPELQLDSKETTLVLIDLGNFENPLGGSALAQVYQQIGDQEPDIDAQLLKSFFEFIQALYQENLVLAYHDRSDGGLLVTILEMAFASHCGFNLDVTPWCADIESVIPFLFNEQIGVVIQVNTVNLSKVTEIGDQFNFSNRMIPLLQPKLEQNIQIIHNGKILLSEALHKLYCAWSETSYQIQKLRDHPKCAQQEYDLISEHDHVGLKAVKTNNKQFEFTRSFICDSPYLNIGKQPKVAVLRTQGINGHTEMAAAFHTAGFDCYDIHMNDLLACKVSLADFNGLVVCGGFSFGDVLQAGRGWALSILENNYLTDCFQQYFQRPDTFTLGVCNGCQMLAHLRTLIPGTEQWPEFTVNESEQFESRLVIVKIVTSHSILLRSLVGDQLPIVVAHGEGRVIFSQPTHSDELQQQNQIVMQYVDGYGRVTENYPMNPNGSPQGITSVCSKDGRVTIMMPHPERVVQPVQLSWCPPAWRGYEYTPWQRMFIDARSWLDEI